MVRIHKRTEDRVKRIRLISAVQVALVDSLVHYGRAHQLTLDEMGKCDLAIARERARLLRDLCFDRGHFHFEMQRAREDAKRNLAYYFKR